MPPPGVPGVTGVIPLEAELELKDADAAARQLQDREQKVEDQVGHGGTTWDWENTWLSKRVLRLFAKD